LGYITVYLPATGDKEIVNLLHQIPDIRWEVFSKTARFDVANENVSIFPVRNDRFMQSLESCSGLLCGAGFEAPAEALFLGKKLFVIPIQGQYEQYCNAAALKEMGVPVGFHFNKQLLTQLKQWLIDEWQIKVAFPDQTEEIIKRLLL
jgi:uncharacterized protein (TIGR00661 family)